MLSHCCVYLLPIFGSASARTPHPLSSDSEPLIDPEQATLEKRWAAGSLRDHCTWVFDFCDSRREEILALSGACADPNTLVSVLKRLIKETGGVNHRMEMQAQLQEILKEIWIRGERGDFDRDRIAAEWASTHGPQWRRWRVRECLYVVERCTPEVVKLLKGAQDDDSIRE